MTDSIETPSASSKDAWIPHVVPFLAWIFFMQLLGDASGMKYALRSAICLGLFIYFRPWRWYGRFRLRNLPLALAAGVLVFAFWVAPETDFAARFEGFHRLYLTLGTQMPWTLLAPPQDVIYAPEVCGWGLTLTRLAGSAFVISFIEEFFWRGWLYRWMIKEDFLKVGMGKLDWRNLLIVALFFGFIHTRWIAGFLCGIVYGLLAIRTRDIWAAGIAHALTNFLLGCYVIWADKYEFWV